MAAGGPGPKAGAIVTGIVVGQAKKGVLVELGSTELLLPRSKYGSAGDWIEDAGYGAAVTVEVVADPGTAGGTGLTRVGIERSLRQPRPIDGRIERAGGGWRLVPADGTAAFPVVLLDHLDPDGLARTTTRWARRRRLPRFPLRPPRKLSRQVRPAADP